MDEPRAIELCLKHRDPVGFEFLVRKYRREAFMHAFGLLGNQEDALDACQESFARAFAAIPLLEKLPRFYPWFYCILRNRCLNLLARQKTSDRYRATEQHDTAPSIEATHPRQLLELQEDQQRMRQALERVKTEHREILLLKYIHEQTYDEIATLLGIPRGTVMSRLYHARSALRDEYLNLDRSADRAAPERAS